MDWDLEDWITDVGADTVDKHFRDSASLKPVERLVQWRGCVDLAAAAGLEAFAPFARAVDSLIAGSEDPYKTLVHGDRDHEDLWYSFQTAAVRELRSLWEGSH